MSTNAFNFPVPEEFNEFTVVKVTNTGSRTFTGGHSGRTYTLAPGASAFIQWDAVCRWVGHPFAINVGADRSNHWRTHEVDRLSTLYGLYSAPWTSADPMEMDEDGAPKNYRPAEYVEQEDGSFRHPHLPSLVVETNEGVVLNTVLADPEGASVTPAEATTRASARDQQAAIAELQRQLSQMQLQMAQTSGAVMADPDFSTDMVADAPSVTPEAKDPSPSRPTVGDPRSAPRGPGRPRKAQ